MGSGSPAGREQEKGRRLHGRLLRKAAGSYLFHVVVYSVHDGALVNDED